MRHNKFLTSSVICSMMILSTGCAATVDKASVQAQAGSPESTKVEVVSIPRNPNLPTFVVAVEPFVFSNTFAANEHGMSINIREGGEQLAAQLTTALANVGNIAVTDSGLRKNNDGTYATKMNKGEVGPFIVRATVTEFTENAEISDTKTGGSLGWLGIIGGVAGAVSGKSGLGWAGAGLAAANPTYENDQHNRKGMVAIDFRVVDGRTSRIVGAFKASGTFASASNTVGVSLFGIGQENHKFAQSVIGQAVRVALNDAVEKINNSLSGHSNS